MDTSPKNNIPWELITQSLSSTLTGEEEVQLQQWLSFGTNREKYLQIQEIWKKGVEDYLIYKEADENRSWNKLHENMKVRNVKVNGNPDVKELVLSRHLRLKKLLAVAAIFIVIIIAGVWLFTSIKTTSVYETMANVHKEVVLKDGSVIQLKPHTRIEVAKNYNEDSRTVYMITGEAFFEVVHQSENPFIVEMGQTQIRDIGTSFTIVRNKARIDVAVSSGEVEFTRIDTKDSRSLTAGTHITFDVQKGSFGNIRKDNDQTSIYDLPDFNNTSLLEAVASIERVYNVKILLDNENIASKKITAHLNGMHLNTVLDVICKSLGLEYSVQDSIYTLHEPK